MGTDQNRAARPQTLQHHTQATEVPARLRRMLALLKEQGHTVNASSRTYQYIRELEQASGREHLIVADADIQRFATALFEGRMIADVFDTFTARPVEHWVRRFVETLDGNPTPGPQDGQARSKLLELFVGATIKSNGFRIQFMADLNKEPDVEVLIDGQRFGVSVKRLQSQSQLTKRLKEGADQLARESRYGFLAVEVTRLLNLDRVIHPIRDVSQGPSLVVKLKSNIEAITYDTQAQLRQRHGNRVFGIAWFASAAVLIESTGHLIGLRFWIFEPVQTGSRLGQAFFSRLQRENRSL